MNPPRRPLVIWFGLLAGAIAVGCEGEAPPPAASKPQVDVSTPVVDAVADYEVFTGRTQAMHYVDLKARVTGELLEKNFKEGDDVKAGQTLFKIDPRPYDATLAQAAAMVNQANTHQQSLQDVYTRDLRSPAATPEATLIQDRDNLEEAKATLKAAEATRQSAQNNVDYCVIKAPFDGRISRLNVDLNNDIIADNTVLASLVQLDPLYGYFDVDERTLLRIGALLPRGMVPADATTRFPLTLGLANENPEEFTHKGTLRIADNKVDPTTGTVRMWGVFGNADYDLKPGMFVRVRMDVGRPQPSLFVAEAALGSDQGRRFLYVVADGKAAYTQVEVGKRKDGRIAVKPAKGYHLSEADEVIVNGLQRVHTGQDIETKRVEMPRATAAGTEAPVVVEKK